MSTEATMRSVIDAEFRAANITPISIQIRTFPNEAIAIIEVDKDYDQALSVAQRIDELIENGFVTIRKVKSTSQKPDTRRVSGVHDDRIPNLIRLLNSRSRTSETQPSLRYIGDVAERLSLAISARHHLIFGRRGVGKTALLLEAKRVLETQGSNVLWVNMQSLRSLGAQHAFLTVALRICDLILGAYANISDTSQGHDYLKQLRANVEQWFQPNTSSLGDVAILVPQIQQACARFCFQSDKSLFIFLDDIHYLESEDVPKFLDLIHGVTRDCPVWLKVAGIQHQTRWFIPDPPTGLQTGHDAAIINLDVTLEQPEKAKIFLEKILRGYAEESNALPLSSVVSASAVDRLVLASGGVPRDFLTLCAASLQTARERDKAKTVGVQDVNNAAGIISQTKQQELEDDAAATSGRSAILVASLNVVREFLLTDEQITFFRIEFRDKELHQAEYRSLQALADLRMIHLINASLSDPHHAGRRSEVYLLDLSQYSGSRLKQNLSVLDFEKGHMVLKRTRSAEAARVGDTVLRLVSLLRRAPVLALERLSDSILPTNDQNTL